MRNFYRASGYATYLEFDEEMARRTLQTMIDSDEALVLVTEGGVSAATMVKPFFSDDLMAQELFWWVDPDKRGAGIGRQMREAMEAWARMRRAKVVAMSCLAFAGVEPAKDKFLKTGYTLSEHGFIRRL